MSIMLTLEDSRMERNITFLPVQGPPFIISRLDKLSGEKYHNIFFLCLFLFVAYGRTGALGHWVKP